MEMLNIFLLSFVSKNMKKLMKLSQVPRFKNINRVVYDNYLFKNDNRAIVVPFKPKSDGIKDAENGYFKLNVSGKNTDFRLPDKGDFPAACFDKSDQESVLESIHYYLLDFFGGDSVDYQLSTIYDKQYSIPQLPHLSVCLTVNPWADMRRFEDVLSSTPVLKHIKMSVGGARELVIRESKFYQAESIRISQTSSAFPAVLRHFQGRQALLSIRKWEDLDFIEFVKRWKSGEAFRKLEYMIIRIKSSFREPQDRILNAIGVKYIEATKQPPTHTLPKVYNDCKPYTDPIISHAYVVRETDNRVASVSIQRNIISDYVWFGVWNKTEEEFLRFMD
ncbi:hypothetical protein B9Z55_009529 [Caenorhabditis nigoni]|uniref:F-box associated domain-containing protein n=2 Tax=Caenorhabditis nigoni TaxID=1611254 RepID=A0A2G5USB8_9PELO|nr:hypothetical protein B9Z55_009529 [Caenorhabditis nigoni]